MSLTCEKRYTLVAEMFYDGTLRRVVPTLTDRLSELFQVVCEYKFVVLRDGGRQHIVTRPVAWRWLVPPDIDHLVLGQMELEPNVKVFEHLAQALTYLDVCAHQEDNM